MPHCLITYWVWVVPVVYVLGFQRILLEDVKETERPLSLGSAVYEACLRHREARQNSQMRKKLRNLGFSKLVREAISLHRNVRMYVVFIFSRTFGILSLTHYR